MYRWLRVSFVKSQRHCTSISTADASLDNRDTTWKFRIWCGNLGALQTGYSSLDSRLRESALMHKNISQLLQQLGIALEESTAVVSWERLPFDEESVPSDLSEESEDDTSNEYFPSTELSMRVASITDILNNLYRLSYKIRNSGLRPSSTRANLVQAVDNETGIDLFHTLHDFDSRHMTELFTAMRQGRFGDNGSSDFLLERLTTSNVLRRKQLRYWERHARKLGIQVLPVRQISGRQRHSESEVQEEVGIPKVQRLELPAPVEEQSRLSGTNATPYDPALDDRTERETIISLASTALDADGKGIEVPKSPEEALNGDSFTYPYCWVHATLPTIFISRERRGWIMKRLCINPVGDAAITLMPCMRHLLREHDRGLSGEQLEDLTSVSKLGRVDDRHICPICFKEQPFPKGLTNHLANHLERIALFALPRTISSDDKNGDESQFSKLFNIDSEDSSTPEPFEEDNEDLTDTQWNTSEYPSDPSTMMPNTAELEELYAMLKNYQQLFASLNSLIVARLTLGGHDKFAFGLASTDVERCSLMTQKLFECNLRVHLNAKDGDSLTEILRFTSEEQEKQIALATEAVGVLGTVHDILEGILQVFEGSISLTSGLSKIGEHQSILTTLLPAAVETATGLKDTQHTIESIEQPPDVTHEVTEALEYDEMVEGLEYAETVEAPEYDETLDPRYRTAPSRMFQPGEVFKTLWEEPAPVSRYLDKKASHYDDYSRDVYVSFRRFIVVANDSDHCTCVAIGIAEIRYDRMVSDNVFLWSVEHQLPKQPMAFPRYANVLKRKAEKCRRDARTRVVFLLYADHISEHLEKYKIPRLCSLTRYDGFPKVFIESLSSEDSIDDMTEYMGPGEATWIEASLFIVQYFSQPERPQILSSNDIWKSPMGDIALKCIQQAKHAFLTRYGGIPLATLSAVESRGDGYHLLLEEFKKAVEDLEDNDWVLAYGANDEWGLVSDERVVIPADSLIIYGFNDEAPFFTAGHVFHTTTGLQALDAELAMKENPWAEVGRLSVGHIRYRLGKDGRTYDQVPILDINWRQLPEVTEVYGVHLREGRRSYHANDYLVMVNYPAITLKRICSTLATFSQEDQVRLLRSLKELNPLFERFGIATVSEMVQREVDAAKNNLTARITDYDGDDLLDLPVFQYPTYGSECELEMDPLSGGVKKQELLFKAASFEPFPLNTDGPVEVSDGGMMFKSFDVEKEKKVTVDEIKTSQVRAETVTRASAPTTDIRFEKDQVQIQRQLNFGPVQLATQRVITDGTLGVLCTDIAIPALDNILNLWNRKESNEILKVSRLCETATIMHNGRLKATVTILPTTLENLKSLENRKDAEDPSKTLTFKDELGEEAKLPFLFAKLKLNFSDDMSEITSGTLWENNQDPSREGAEGIRHLIMSRPGSASQRVPIRIGQGQIVRDIPMGGPTENATLNLLCLLEALKQHFPVLQKFINDGGEKWAQAYLDQLLNVKMDDIVEDMESNPRILYRYTTILWVLYPEGNYHERFRDGIYNKLLGFAMIQRVSKDAVMYWLPHITKTFIDGILNENYEEIDKDLRDLLRKELDIFMAAHRDFFEKNGKEFAAKNCAGMVHILVSGDLAAKSLMIIGVEPLEGKLKSGWKGLGLAFKMSLFGLSIYNIVMRGKGMSAAQIGRVTTDVTKGFFDILTPFLLRPEARNAREPVFQCQVINQTSGRKLPAYALGKANATELKFDVYDANLEDFAKVENEKAAREIPWFGRMRQRLSISSRVIRWLGIAINVVVVAFMIWDLCNQWDHLSGTGRGLAIAQISIETAAAIVGIIGLFSTCALIPVPGQVLMVAGLVISIFYLVYGRPEPEKTPGEEFVDSMRGDNGWLKKIDDPPSTTLEYTITPTEMPKDADFSFKITGENTKSSSIEFISAPNAEKPSSDTEILSIKFGFTTGSDTVCLFSNESFSTASDAKDGKCSYNCPDDIFQTRLMSPMARKTRLQLPSVSCIVEVIFCHCICDDEVFGQGVYVESYGRAPRSRLRYRDSNIEEEVGIVSSEVENSQFKVIIIGAGVTSLTLAHCLAKAGIDFVLLDKGVMAPSFGTIITLQSHAWVVRIVVIPPERAFVSNDFFSVVRNFAGCDTRTLDRHVCQLYQMLPDKPEVYEKFRVKEIIEENSVARVILADGREFVGDVVVGSDGVHSKVREIMWDKANALRSGMITVDEKRAMVTQYNAVVMASSPVPGIGAHDMEVTTNDKYSFLLLCQP
ncbi:hypothetical protein FACUT_3161 [Fusarium acutatum]|uniref:DUF6590 domain-containing protein n=1 Tax=Fusarium acutatum TaxID=78861 RepID=A0A8H4K193_9HYPO|nr:hypothetical protein FACUT_3161 [Fusarium acutatum]